MKKSFTIGLILILVLSIVISCSTSPTAKIQGVFEVNKESLKESLQKEMKRENAFAKGLLNAALENAVIEFNINGDSINGILFLAGEITLLESQIIERDDSLVIKTSESEAYLIPTETGLSFRVSGAEMTIKLNKTKRTELSADTKKAIEAQKIAIKEKKEFEQNLGKWQEENYVDEFGDKTSKRFAYCIIRGTSKNSISTKSEVYVEAIVQSGTLYFQIYNSSFNIRESFPNGKSGKIKLKFPDGSVKSKKVLFLDNRVWEFDNKVTLYDYISQNAGVVKVFIDLCLSVSFPNFVSLQNI